MTNKSKLIEFTEIERNLIRYCVENELKRKQEAGDQTCVEILTPVYEKLLMLREREIREGVNGEPVFV